MDADRLEELFEKHDGEHGMFDRIPKADRLSPHDELCGMMKVASLMKPRACWQMAAEHDVIYLAGADDLQDLTDDDVIYLLRCGIFWDPEYDCLSFFT